MVKGNIDWAEVREELANIRFSGWATAEVAGGDAQQLDLVSKQMDEVPAISRVA